MVYREVKEGPGVVELERHRVPSPATPTKNYWGFILWENSGTPCDLSHPSGKGARSV